MTNPRTSDLFEALDEQHARFTELRRRFHTTPETAYDEHGTAALIAEELRSYGLEVHEGVGRTGVVGVLRNGTSPRTIGLRADIDALPIVEQNDLPYRSLVAGKMHACGHDGHTTMLLMAAHHLSQTQDFDGTVVFIFQPAEEGGAGARTMVEDGLFERFPVDRVFGAHNIPGMPVGTFGVRSTAMMAAGDYFEVVLRVPGAHAAEPHRTSDPILAASAFVQGLQAVVSRVLDPLDPGVLSITTFHGGEAANVIPSEVRLQGTARSYSAKAQAALEAGVRRFAAGTATSYGLTVEVDWKRGYPATINSPTEAAFAREVLEGVVGAEHVLTDLEPLMTAEDFSFMLDARPGAYLWIGNGDSTGLHTPTYNFNDDALPIGAAMWVRLAETALDNG